MTAVQPGVLGSGPDVTKKQTNMATSFGLSLDYLQAEVHKYEVKSVSIHCK
jgi:hypothetical protein